MISPEKQHLTVISNESSLDYRSLSNSVYVGLKFMVAEVWIVFLPLGLQMRERGNKAPFIENVCVWGGGEIHNPVLYKASRDDKVDRSYIQMLYHLV